MRGRTRSSANTVWPVTLAAASALGSDRPMIFNERGASATGYLAAHPRSGQLHRFEDLQVPRAAAEVPGQGFGDLLARGLRLLAQQGFRHQQETGRAVAALGRAQLHEGLL